MINKNGLWVITLVSIVLVLGIYYISMPGDEIDLPISNEVTKSVMSNETALAALKVENDEEVLARMEELQGILLDVQIDSSEKNLAYEELVMLTNDKGVEEKIQEEIMNTFEFESFVKINNDVISVVIASEDHTDVVANSIIRLVQDKFDIQKFITVKFQ